MQATCCWVFVTALLVHAVTGGELLLLLQAVTKSEIEAANRAVVWVRIEILVFERRTGG